MCFVEPSLLQLVIRHNLIQQCLLQSDIWCCIVTKWTTPIFVTSKNIRSKGLVVQSFAIFQISSDGAQGDTATTNATTTTATTTADISFCPTD